MFNWIHSVIITGKEISSFGSQRVWTCSTDRKALGLGPGAQSKSPRTNNISKDPSNIPLYIPSVTTNFTFPPCSSSMVLFTKLVLEDPQRFPLEGELILHSRTKNFTCSFDVYAVWDTDLVLIFNF